MGTPQNIPMLDINSPTFSQDMMDLLGLKPGEKLEIITPQFERTDGKVVGTNDIDFANLHLLDDDTLKSMGLGIWNQSEAGTHWLFPKEFYEHIPAGHPVLVIDGKTELFEPGQTDDDIRYGMLAYGFMKPNAS